MKNVSQFTKKRKQAANLHHSGQNTNAENKGNGSESHRFRGENPTGKSGESTIGEGRGGALRRRMDQSKGEKRPGPDLKTSPRKKKQGES